MNQDVIDNWTEEDEYFFQRSKSNDDSRPAGGPKKWSKSMSKKSNKGIEYQDQVNAYIGAMDGVGVGVDGEDGNLADRYSIESKNVQAGSVRAFLRQAETQCGERTPVVVMADFTKREQGAQVRRRAMGQSLVTMRLDDWLDLVRHSDAPVTEGKRTIYSFVGDDLIAWADEQSLTVSTFGSGQMTVRPHNDMISISVDKGEEKRND